MRTIHAPLVYHTADGQKLQRSTQSTVIPDGWNSQMRDGDLEAYGLYIRRTLRVLFMQQIHESRTTLLEVCLHLRKEKLKINQQINQSKI